MVAALLPAILLTMFLTVPRAAADESQGQPTVGPGPCLGGVGLCTGSGPAPQPTSGDPALIDPAYFSPLGSGALYQTIRPTTTAQKDSLRAFERDAVSRVMTAHGLPDSDTAAVETWGRSEAEARLWSMIVAAIKTPAAERTSDQQNVVDWLTSVVQRQNEKSSYDAGLEYAKWAGLGADAYRELMETDPSEHQLADFLSERPYNYGPGNSIKTRSSTSNEGYCTYVSPTDDTRHKYTANIYDADLVSPDCYAPCPAVTGCLPTTPDADKFLEWGKYDQMDEIFGSAGQYFKKNFAISAGAIAGTTMLVGVGAAALASAGIVAFVPGEAVASTVFTYAMMPAALNSWLNGAEMAIAGPWVSLLDVAGIAGIVITGLAMIASETVLVVTAANVPKDLAKSITAKHIPDLSKLLDQSRTASGLFGLFVLATMSPNDGNIATYPTRPAMPAPSEDDTQLTITSADGSTTTSRDLQWFYATDSAPIYGQTRIHDGWFVGSVTDRITGETTSAQALSISYTDWDGDPRTASLVPDGHGGNLFSTVSGDAETGTSSASGCLQSGDCTLSKSIQYITPDGAAQTATLPGAASPPPTSDPNAGCPDSGTVICLHTDTTVAVSPMIGQAGRPLSITAHVVEACISLGSPCDLVTSGTVAFALHGNPSGDQSNDTPPTDCSAAPVNSHGDATCTWTPSATWSGTVTATYIPAADNGYYSSSDSEAVRIGTLASTTTTLDAPGAAALGDTVTLTADVANAYDDGADPDPSGAVRFVREGVTMCTGTVDAGVATCTATIADSSRNITAVYMGDAEHEWSTDSAQITVPPGPIVVHVDVPATFVQGRPARIDAWLTADGVPPSGFPASDRTIEVRLAGSDGVVRSSCGIAKSGGDGSCLLTPKDTGQLTLTVDTPYIVLTSGPDPYGLAGDDVSDVSMQIDVVEPSEATQTVTAPPSARPGQQLSLSGAGWRGDASVRVVLFDPANQEVARSLVTTEADGSFPADATVTVPRDVSSGQFLITAVDDAGYAARSPLSVGGAAVNDRVVLSSPTVEAGNDVAVTGRRWPAKTSIAVMLYSPGGAEVARVSSITDGDGRIPAGVTLTVPVGSATGLYSVLAISGAVRSDPVPLAVNGPLAQKLSFGSGDSAVPDGAVRYGGTFTPAATSDAGLPVVISATGACRRDASTGVVTMTAGSGVCTVTALQAGNDYYQRAQIDQSVTATTAKQTVAFAPPDLGAVGTSVDLSAKATASSGLPVTVTVDTARSSPADACTVSDTTVTFWHVGTCVLDANQSGNDNYAAADTVSAAVTVVDSTTPTTTTTSTMTTTASTPTAASTAPRTPPATTKALQRSTTTVLPAGGSATWPVAVPSPGTPVVASVMSPNAGAVTFTKTALATLPPGYVLVGNGFMITAPPATATHPLHMHFAVLDAGIPTGADLTTLTVFRDGQAVPACVATRSTEADPDPCVASVRSTHGVTTLTVLSRHASTWSVGVRMQGASTTTEPDQTHLTTGGLGSSGGPGTSGTIGASGGGGSPTARAHDDNLASTGFPLGFALFAGAVLLLIGLGLATASRRRRHRAAH